MEILSINGLTHLRMVWTHGRTTLNVNCKIYSKKLILEFFKGGCPTYEKHEFQSNI